MGVASLLGIYGLMMVFARERRSPDPRYFVRNSKSGRILEEFRRKISAIRWAKQNRTG